MAAAFRPLIIPVLVVIGVVACVIPWLTTLVFIRTEHSSKIGYDGASFWHSGLPFRFLTRSDISVGGTIDSFAYWSDVFFWFFIILALIAPFRHRFHHASKSTVA